MASFAKSIKGPSRDTFKKPTLLASLGIALDLLPCPEALGPHPASVEPAEQHNRKRWRIRQPLERLRTKPQRRAAIRNLLSAACEQAELIGDQQLAEDLKTLVSRVKRRQAGGSNR